MNLPNVDLKYYKSDKRMLISPVLSQSLLSVLAAAFKLHPDQQTAPRDASASAADFLVCQYASSIFTCCGNHGIQAVKSHQKYSIRAAQHASSKRYSSSQSCGPETALPLTALTSLALQERYERPCPASTRGRRRDLHECRKSDLQPLDVITVGR